MDRAWTGENIRKMKAFFSLLMIGTVFHFAGTTTASERILTPRLHHLRLGKMPEWDDFPKHTDGSKLVLRFQGKSNDHEQTLWLRQQDVRQTWKVLLNGKELGRLPPDENDMAIVLPVPAGRLIAGEN